MSLLYSAMDCKSLSSSSCSSDIKSPSDYLPKECTLNGYSNSTIPYLGNGVANPCKRYMYGDDSPSINDFFYEDPSEYNLYSSSTSFHSGHSSSFYEDFSKNGPSSLNYYLPSHNRFRYCGSSVNDTFLERDGYNRSYLSSASSVYANPPSGGRYSASDSICRSDMYDPYHPSSRFHSESILAGNKHDSYRQSSYEPYNSISFGFSSRSKSLYGYGGSDHLYEDSFEADPSRAFIQSDYSSTKENTASVKHANPSASSLQNLTSAEEGIEVSPRVLPNQTATSMKDATLSRNDFVSTMVLKDSCKGNYKKGIKKEANLEDEEVGNPDDIDPTINPRVFSGKKPKRNMDYSKYVIDLNKVRMKADNRLTVMLKNIPNGFTQEFMIHILNSFVENEFDFFYMPVDFKTNCNLGFGYVSMISTDSVVHIYEALNHKKWPNTPSSKICEVVYARMQGRSDMQRLCKDWAIMNLPEQYRPVFFEKSPKQVDGKDVYVMKRTM